VVPRAGAQSHTAIEIQGVNLYSGFIMKVHCGPPVEIMKPLNTENEGKYPGQFRYRAEFIIGKTLREMGKSRPCALLWQHHSGLVAVVPGTGTVNVKDRGITVEPSPLNGLTKPTRFNGYRKLLVDEARFVEAVAGGPYVYGKLTDDELRELWATIWPP